MKKSESDIPEISPSGSALQAQTYIPVREAAQLMGISVRSVYGYIEAGKLPAYRIGRMFVVEAEHVHKYQRQAVGRRRERVPVWHIPPAMNAQYLTSITVQIRQGQSTLFDQKILEIRVGRKHLLPGTSARYIVRNHARPDDVQIIFVWRQTFMPSEEARKEAVAALYNDLSDILDWESASFQEGRVVLTA